jgi:hypothetical protein
MMETQHIISRRNVFKSSMFGLISLSIPNLVYANSNSVTRSYSSETLGKNNRYPSIDDEIVNDVVGSSHFNFDHVQELVNHRPELARANWDWSFGDWESALGAASHVGRRDIANFLISKGARPNIFTFAMFGNYEVVKSMIESIPILKTTDGPHGISLLRHAQAGLRSKDITGAEKSNNLKLIDYLEELNENVVQPKYIELTVLEKEKYMGDYRYGDGEKDGFSIKQNMRKRITLGKLGNFGGGLYQKAPNVFSYNGITSVEITFEEVDGKILSLTVNEPDLVLKALKV